MQWFVQLPAGRTTQVRFPAGLFWGHSFLRKAYSQQATSTEFTIIHPNSQQFRMYYPHPHPHPLWGYIFWSPITETPRENTLFWGVFLFIYLFCFFGVVNFAFFRHGFRWKLFFFARKKIDMAIVFHKLFPLNCSERAAFAGSRVLIRLSTTHRLFQMTWFRAIEWVCEWPCFWRNLIRIVTIYFDGCPPDVFPALREPRYVKNQNIKKSPPRVIFVQKGWLCIMWWSCV